MSEFKVPLTKILDIQPHPGADRLMIATVYGFQIVIPKDKYQVGDLALLVPIDSVLPKDLEDFLFAPDAKIKLHNSRVKQIRIRNFASQGMLISKEDFQSFSGLKNLKEEHDYAEELKINKYEPPEPAYQGSKTGLQTRAIKPLENKLFHKFNGLESVKFYPNVFQDGEEVVIQEKLHGSNIRAAILPALPTTFSDIKRSLQMLGESRNKKETLKLVFSTIKRFIKGKLGLNPKFDKCYGSNNVELTNRVGYTGYYGSDIYGAVLNKVGAFDKMVENEIIFGELIGAGIQKNYDYGLKDSHTFVLFDVKILNQDGTYRWLKPEDVAAYAHDRGFDFVPVLYNGPYNKEQAYALTFGDSVYAPSQKVREGIVIKSKENYNDSQMPSAKRSLKWISEKYLDKEQSDFH